MVTVVDDNGGLDHDTDGGDDKREILFYKTLLMLTKPIAYSVCVLLLVIV